MEKTAPVSECRGECQAFENYATEETYLVDVITSSDKVRSDWARQHAAEIIQAGPRSVRAEKLANRLREDMKWEAEKFTEGRENDLCTSLLMLAVGRVNYRELAGMVLDQIKEEDDHGQSHTDISQRVG